MDVSDHPSFFGFLPPQQQKQETTFKPFYERVGVTEICEHGVGTDEDCTLCEVNYLHNEIARHELNIQKLHERLAALNGDQHDGT